jgi:hypothetical protein
MYSVSQLIIPDLRRFYWLPIRREPMKRLAMILAVVVGIIPGITSQVAYSDSSIDFIQTRIVSETSNKQTILDIEELRKPNIAEINFTVRMYLWALAQRHPEILAKVTAPALQCQVS